MGINLGRVTALVERGTTYAEQTAKKAAMKTRLGRGIRDGMHRAKEAMSEKFHSLKAEVDNVTKYKEIIARSGRQKAFVLSQDKQFVDAFERYAQKTGLDKAKYNEMSENELFVYLLEHGGVGPGKAAQIISNNKAYLSKFTPEQQEIIKAQCSKKGTTRTVEEASEILQKAFPEENIKVVKGLSQGTVGESYIVKRADGSNAVVKMVKKGVDKEQLDLEETVFTRIIGELSETPKEKAKMTTYFKNLYKDWKEELNFSSEYEANKLLQRGAEKYKVANITNLSEDGSCIVMDMANGIQMDKLMKILKDYKANPEGFAQRYADEISKNPWLANPEKVMKDLPKSILKAFDEQFMFMKKGGTSIMHGDPHMGNYFITTDKKGRLIPEFIDTGNCVKRSAAQISDDIKFFSNYFVGNSEGVAKYFVDQCGSNIANKEELVSKVAKDIQGEIFGKTQNITAFEDVQNSIQTILERYGLSMSPENATAMKAQMQFFAGISDAGKLTGKKLDFGTIIGDIPKAAWGMIKRGYNPWSALKESLKFAKASPVQAAGTAYQFKLANLQNIAVSKSGELEVLA